jgi:hypothetical protein
MCKFVMYKLIDVHNKTKCKGNFLLMYVGTIYAEIDVIDYAEPAVL